MRILLTADPFIPVPPTGYGGIERIVDALVRHCRQRGHVVGIVARAGSTVAADARFAWPDTGRGPWSNVRNALALRNAARDFRADIVHSFSRLAYLVPTLTSTRIPCVMSYQRHTGGRQTSVAARMGGERLAFTGCSNFICRMGAEHGGDWHCIPNFVETDRLRFSPAVAPDAPLLFLSRLDSIKGPDLAIAIAKESGRRLILAGNIADAGPEREFFELRVKPQLGHNRIEWVGEVDDAQKNELLGKSAALLVPIQWDEPFGIVFAEALACGTPVISCRRGALPEIIDEGKTGFFVNGIDDGAKAVRDVAMLSRSECRRMAEQKFSADAVVPRYLDLYARMTGRP